MLSAERRLLVLLVLVALQGVCPDIIIEQLPIVTAALGQNVTLPCHLRVSNDKIISKPIPYWDYENNLGKLWPDPSERYQNRVSLLSQEDSQSLDKSIRLKHVQWEDAGQYQCEVSIGMQQGGRFRKKGNKTELLIYGPISLRLNNSQLQCEVPVSRHPGFALSISSNDQILKSAPGPNATSALYETLSQTISLVRSHRKYQCSLNFNGKLVSSRVHGDQVEEEHPQPWSLHGGLILVKLVILLVVTLVILRNSCL